VLEIRFLGQQRLVVDGDNVTARVPPRSIALLAQLVLHPAREQPRAALAALFWPESTDDQALTNLRRELHQLRALLPGLSTSLSSSGRTVAWEPGNGTECDVVSFLTEAAASDTATRADDTAGHLDHARMAVDRYSGDLLPAWTHEWVLAERERLHTRCLGLLDGLVQDARNDHDLGQALVFAQRRLEMEPLAEPAYRIVMQLQAETGNRAGALRTYHRCASLLERSLGVAPDPATAALYESLLDRPGKQASARRTAGPRVGRLPLVGRQAEVDALSRRWQTARRGRSGMHLLNGVAGVGKTRLLSELAGEVQRHEDLVARARCFAGGATLPMGPVAEWLSSRALRQQLDGLDPAWAAEVERLVPSTASHEPPPQPMVDGWQRHRFFLGLVHAVLDVARPTLLTLDDVQWCDGETLAWLHFFLREAHGKPLLVLASARAEELGDNPAASRLLVALGQEGRLSRTDVEPLDATATVELARLAGREPDDEAALVSATGGYPLFVIESARVAVDGSGPPDAIVDSPRVQAVLEGRLAQLSDDAAAIARLASVVGRDFDPELLEEASDLPAEAVANALDELWRRRLLGQRGQGTYDFTHDLLRDAARRQVSPAAASLMHRRVAQALALRARGDLDDSPARIAYHYEQAGTPGRAVPFHLAAADLASRRFAYDHAIDHYTAARGQLARSPAGPQRDRQELQLLHAMSAPVNARHGYASPQLQDVLERAAELGARLHDRSLETLSLIGLFSAYVVQGRLPESYEVAVRALRRSEGQEAVEGQAHFAVAGAATMLGRHSEALAHFAVVPEMTLAWPPALVGTRPEVHSRAWEAHTLWLVGRTAEARAALDWALARAREVDHPYSLAVALAYDAMLAQFEGRRSAVAEAAATTEDLCRTYGFAYYGEWARILAGWALGGSAGLAKVRGGLSGLDELGAHLRRPFYRCLEAELLVEIGDVGGARATLQAAVEAARQRRDLWWLSEVLRRLALVDESRPDVDLLTTAMTVAAAQGCQSLTARIERDAASLTHL